MIGKAISEYYDKLKSDRSTWESHWQECADYINPKKDDINRQSTAGEKKHQHILDNSAIMANELLAGALHGLLTNPSEIFFDLSTGDLSLDDDDEVRFWLQDTAKRMIDVMNNSNFQTEVHEMYLDLGCFGTAPMSIEEDDKLIVRFTSRTISQCVIDENYLGEIDVLIRNCQMGLHQIVQQFGMEALSEKMKKEYEKNSHTKYEVLQAILPKMLAEKLDTQYRPTKMLPFVSLYVLKAEHRVLREGGFEEFPFVVSRWSKLPGEKYGRSPGMAALPEAKMINKMAETVIKGAQKVVDPPVQVPSDGFVLPLNTKPGGVNYYMSGTGSRDEIKTIFNDTRIDFGFEVMNSTRQRIREAFFVDQLQLNQGPQMTATEVLQRTEEKARLLGPLLGRQNHEFLKPMINRVFNIMFKRGLFREVPRQLEGRELQVRYSSMIAKAQRLNQATSIVRAQQLIQPFIALDPSVADNFNGDMAVRGIWSLIGAPQYMLRNNEDIEGIRESRQQAQAQMIQAQQAGQEAQTQKMQAEAVNKLQAV